MITDAPELSAPVSEIAAAEPSAATPRIISAS